MAARLISLSGRLVVAALLFHAVLLPVLFVAIVTVVDTNATEAFLDDARIQGRLLADGIDVPDPEESRDAVVAQLDSAMLGGRIVFATLRLDDTVLTSSLMSEADVSLFREDFDFGEHGDDTYFVSLPVVVGDATAALHLGFDETPTMTHIQDVRRSITGVLVAYLAITLLSAVYLSRILVRPIKWLQRVSRAIASGEYEEHLSTDSNVAEIHELASDLEHMRSNLVGTNERLQEEMRERELADAERRSLESRLRRMQKLESLGTLAGGVAHEFNNVLQPLLLYTELALEDLPEDSKVSENLDRVLELANRAKGLSRQILTFGRQTDDAPMEETELRPVVEEAIAMIRALLPATVDIRTHMDLDAAMVRCSPTHIQQLLVNLCNNAFQALNGSGFVEVSIGRQEFDESGASKYPKLRAGAYAVIQVADTGCGMDRETAARVFEPFFTTQDVGQGTGLGLSVVHGIVMRHDGEIVLESEPGEGTTIRVFLPLIGAVEARRIERG